MLGVVPGLTPEKPTDWLGRQTGALAHSVAEGIHLSFFARADNRYLPRPVLPRSRWGSRRLWISTAVGHLPREGATSDFSVLVLVRLQWRQRVCERWQGASSGTAIGLIATMVMVMVWTAMTSLE